MKRILLILIAAGLIGFLGSGGLGESKSDVKKNQDIQIDPTKTKTAKIITQEGIFVPYWSLKTFTPEEGKSYFYFGVTGEEDGINTKDVGYQNLEDYFALLPQDAKRIVVIKMTDSSLNSQILKNMSAQKKIIDDSIKLARAYRLDGILLDFEMSSISFEAVTNRVTGFYKSFYEVSHNENLAFYITMYGDTVYRVRPYDLEKLSQYADQVFIMAYDFNKARGNPGPNFPLNGREEYGYDFKKMTEDFLTEIPSNKLSVIFGMFGYDWKIDSQGKSKETASPLTLNQIKQKLIKCQPNCENGEDVRSSESWIKYKDEEENNHIIWYETEKSVNVKQAYLKSKGINSFSFWAYSYY